ncbi:MAG TPA: ATP-binding protein [Methylomirabilota bacterium]|nr:ATP-binding protein [Methylomirabilota bacterium]
MSLHNLVPLIAFLLNLSLAGISLVWNAGSRLNRVFAYFISGLAVWNLGVFMLRRSPDEGAAFFWEVFIHIGVIAIPAFYYHFVLIFLDSTIRHRRSLLGVYAISLLFVAVNVSGSSLLMDGVKRTYWGWAPATGPLYLPFFLFFNAVLISGIYQLVRGYRAIDSSFRRNRTLLILLGSFVCISGGTVDFLRFILARFFPAVDQFYPVGIPANMVFALMLGVSIVRYRLFDVSAAVKKAAIYTLMYAVFTSFLVVATRTMERYFNWEETDLLWVIVPVGFLSALCLGRLEGLVERVIISKRRGCYETLLALSKRMSTILNLGTLVETLVEGVARGIPVTHCVLLIYDKATNSYVPCREESCIEEPLHTRELPAGSAVVQWLTRADELLVKEEVKLNPAIAEYFEASEGELETIHASLILPLKIENRLIGIVLLGEKLSGEIFDGPELEVLRVLANQAAISIENARLYEELGGTNARLVQANRLKSQFLASMSHELRTPLNSIIGFSKVILNQADGGLSEPQKTYIRSVHNSGTHLLELINSVLDISRIEAGKSDLRAEPFDLHELVEECIESSMPLVRAKPVKLQQEVPIEFPPLCADRTKVKQILLNLLSNAIKFTNAGCIVVRVQQEGEITHVSVADSGIGIRSEDLPRLFEPFGRLESPLARETGGTGLGLAISKKFVELHKGSIWVESREQHGSTFHFTLPLVPAGAGSVSND